MAETLGRFSWQRPQLTLVGLPDFGLVQRTGCGAAGLIVLAPCWVLKEQARAWDFGRRSHLGVQTAAEAVCVLRVGVGWLFVEMCIVDASIFVSLCR
jgi:hypothetical protein